MILQRLLRPSDVAERLSVSRAWVYDAAKLGRIPAIRVGGEDGPLRFIAEDVERWLDDARAGWISGRPTVATRKPPPRANPRSSRERRSQASAQQRLI
jgi:excisionase family DNA binding protein